MPRKPSFNPIETPDGWKLSIPPKYSQTGKRQRRFYKTKRDALAARKKFLDELQEFGVQATAIRPALAELATAADELLKPFDVTILEAAQIVADMKASEAASIPLKPALDDWLADCGHLRDKTLQGYRYTARRMEKALGDDRLLSTIEADELMQALAPPGTPSTSAKGHLRVGKAFWNHAAEKGWCRAEIFKSVKPPKSRNDDKEIEILSPAEIERLMRTAEEHFPQAVASYALAAFAGIRAEEITRLEAENVTAEGIELTAAVTKKGRRRHIVPNDTLRAWLKKYPFQPCSNWRRIDRACRCLAGWRVAPDAQLVEIDTTAETFTSRSPWPQNALRHSHATYSIAAGASLESLLWEFGHTGNASVLRAHYVGRSSKKQALEFFAIVPEGEAKPKTIQGVA